MIAGHCSIGKENQRDSVAAHRARLQEQEAGRQWFLRDGTGIILDVQKRRACSSLLELRDRAVERGSDL